MKEVNELSEKTRDNLIGALIGAVLGLILSIYALNHLESSKTVVKAATPRTQEEFSTDDEMETVEIVSIEKVTVDIVTETEPTTEPITEEAPVLYDIPLSDDLQIYITELCEEVNISPLLVFAIIEKESRYTADIMGDNGKSYGLMQIQAKWHKERMDRLGCKDLLNPYDNVKVGIDILVELFAKNHNLNWVLMAYNGGCSYANNRIEQGILTSDYADSVLEKIEKLKEVKR